VFTKLLCGKEREKEWRYCGDAVHGDIAGSSSVRSPRDLTSVSVIDRTFSGSFSWLQSLTGRENCSNRMSEGQLVGGREGK
jgi:hypothetical protein